MLSCISTILVKIFGTSARANADVILLTKTTFFSAARGSATPWQFPSYFFQYSLAKLVEIFARLIYLRQKKNFVIYILSSQDGYSVLKTVFGSLSVSSQGSLILLRSPCQRYLVLANPFKTLPNS